VACSRDSRRSSTQRAVDDVVHHVYRQSRQHVDERSWWSSHNVAQSVPAEPTHCPTRQSLTRLPPSSTVRPPDSINLLEYVLSVAALAQIFNPLHRQAVAISVRAVLWTVSDNIPQYRSDKCWFNCLSHVCLETVITGSLCWLSHW